MTAGILKVTMTQPHEFKNLINPPEFPLPWRPSERAAIKRRLFSDNIDTASNIRETLRAVDSNYVITDFGVQAVQMAIGYTAVGAEVFHEHETTQRPVDDVQREFENTVLGLPPLPYGDGLRHSEHPAGFGGGTYPIDAFADLVNTDIDTFRALLNDETATKFGYVMVKSSHYLTPVKRHRNDMSLVHADRATQLSKQGEAMLDIALSIADYSSR